MMALEGIKVLDLSPNAAGQFGTMVLGDLGADVLAVERPPTGRRALYDRTIFGVASPEESRRRARHSALSRNKRSIVLDLKQPEGIRIFHQLAEGADVVVEGFRPGVVKRLGVDYDAVSRTNPRIVYCSLSGYGQNGPYSSMAGHDVNYISHAGVLDLVGNDENDRPAIPLNLLADYAGGGLTSAVAILAALMAREKTGRGQYLDIAMTDGVFYMMAGFLADYMLGGGVPKRGGLRLNGATPYYNTYRTADGKYISIAALEPWFWENLCRALGRDDLIPHQFSGGEMGSKISRTLEDAFRSRTRDEWFEEFKDKDIAVGKVLSLDEVLDDPQMAARDMVVEVGTQPDDAVKQPGIPFKLSDTPAHMRSAGPAPGEHTREVLAELGYTGAQIENLVRKSAAHCS